MSSFNKYCYTATPHCFCHQCPRVPFRGCAFSVHKFYECFLPSLYGTSLGPFSEILQECKAHISTTIDECKSKFCHKIWLPKMTRTLSQNCFVNGPPSPHIPSQGESQEFLQQKLQLQATSPSITQWLALPELRAKVWIWTPNRCSSHADSLSSLPMFVATAVLMVLVHHQSVIQPSVPNKCQPKQLQIFPSPTK